MFLIFRRAYHDRGWMQKLLSLKWLGYAYLGLVGILLPAVLIRQGDARSQDDVWLFTGAAIALTAVLAWILSVVTNEGRVRFVLASSQEEAGKHQLYLLGAIYACALLPTLVFAWAAPPLPRAEVCRVALQVEPRAGLLVGVSDSHIYLLEAVQGKERERLGVFELSTVEEYFVSGRNDDAPPECVSQPDDAAPGETAQP
jgi:hypothetical protein